jgi:transposase
MQAISIPTVYG